MFGKVFVWLGRKAFLYVALLAAILAYAVWSSGDIQAAWTDSQTLNLRRADILDKEVVRAELRRKEFEQELKLAGERAQQQTVDELEQQISVARIERDRLGANEPSRLQKMMDAATLDVEAIRKEHERVLLLAFLDRKIGGLEKAAEAARNQAAAIEKAAALAREIAESIAANSLVIEQRRLAYRAARQSCRSAIDAVVSFDASWIKTTLDRLPWQRKRADLVRAEIAECAKRDTAENALHDAVKVANQLRRRQASVNRYIPRAQAWVQNTLPDTVEALRAQVAEERASAQATITAWVNWA